LWLSRRRQDQIGRSGASSLVCHPRFVCFGIVPVPQRVSANAIHALKDALSAVFWWKKDLYNYAKAAVSGEPLFLAGIPWTDSTVTKRDSVSLFVDRLVREQDEHQDLLIALTIDVAGMEDFPQLRRCEDADTKIATAKAAVSHLRSVVQPYEQALADRAAAARRIDAARVAADQRRATATRIAQLKSVFYDIAGLQPQRRGFAFERLLGDLFETYDLDPRASFRVTGEQIDGGFTLDTDHFLLEAKWESRPADRAALDVFSTKVGRRGENTLGLFVAISGFEPNAVALHSNNRSPLMLMDGMDLNAVLEDRIELPELLRRKRRHVAMTGNVLITATEILQGA
jgi:hypothetical protein